LVIDIETIPVYRYFPYIEASPEWTLGYSRNILWCYRKQNGSIYEHSTHWGFELFCIVVPSIITWVYDECGYGERL